MTTILGIIGILAVLAFLIGRARLARLALDLLQWLVLERPPDLVIGGADNPYMRRWYLLPRNRWLNLYLHNILRDDDDRALHDHPWSNLSWILAGGYFESLPEPGAEHDFREIGMPQMAARRVHRRPGSFVLRLRPTQAHRLILPRAPDGGLEFSDDFGMLAMNRSAATSRPSGEGLEAWTLFMTGPVRRTWGFHCARGWVHWRDFTAGPRGETVGAGCEQDWASYSGRPGAPGLAGGGRDGVDFVSANDNAENPAERARKAGAA